MKQGGTWYWFVVWFTRRIIFGLTGGTTVKGLENIPKTGPVIIAPVHVSHLDPMLVGCTSPRVLRFMAKEELFKGIFGWLLRSLNSFAVKRGASDTAAIRLALGTLQEGGALMLFPEGTRGDAKTMGEFQAGVAMMAKKSNAQVVPVGIGGSAEMFPKGGKLKRGHLTIIYGEPFTFDQMVKEHGKKEARDAFNAHLMQRIQSLCQEAGLTLAIRNASEASTQPPDPRPGTEAENSLP